jgi:glycosidase
MLSLADKIFYHIYPIGFCGVSKKNDFTSYAGNGLKNLIDFIPHLSGLGINAIYIGPLFESSSHGYDTVDYYWIDRRLGTNEDLKLLIEELHKNNILVILDTVFNHTGRDFFAFKDIQQNGTNSPYREWYKNLNFQNKSPYNDNFSYEAWSGCYDLVKLNTSNIAVKEHLFGAVKCWVETFDIDGLRLDAAENLDIDFLKSLSEYSKSLKDNFWLMGEVVLDKYDKYAFEGCLDSATNYSLYKGLWSSFNDKNFFELAWTLNQHFGENGKYKNIALYNFLDNHDTNRIASILKNKAYIFELYSLFFTLPGIPSIYYGSEYGALGQRTKWNDNDLRPSWNELKRDLNSDVLYNEVKKYIAIRKNKTILQNGSFRQIFVAHEQYVFIREDKKGYLNPIMVIISSSEKEEMLKLKIKDIGNYQNTKWKDIINNDEHYIDNNGITIKLYPYCIRMLEKVA